MDQQKKKLLLLVVVIIVFIVILLVILGFVGYVVSGSYSNKSFVAGYTGDKYSVKSRTGSLIELERGTKELLEQKNSNRLYDITHIHNFYSGFMRNHKKSCPQQIYDRIVEIMQYIKYETNFSHTGTNAYLIVSDCMLRLHEILEYTNEAAEFLSDTIGDGRYKKMAKDKEIIMDHDEHMVRNVMRLTGAKADAVLVEMKKQKQATGRAPGYAYAEALIPNDENMMSAYEVGVRDGTQEEFDGDFSTYRRNVCELDTVENDEAGAVSMDLTDKDLNVTRTTQHQERERNTIMLTNYRGHSASNLVSRKNNKCLEC